MDRSIVTNGILLSQEEDDFWKTCHDRNIGVLISAYPIKIAMDKIWALAKKFDVDVRWMEGQDKIETFHHVPIDLSGSCNAKQSFGVCTQPNRCITLSHGRLFLCSFAPHVHHFNKKFGTSIEITDADSIDIYREEDKEVIFRKLSEPVPVCRYCNQSIMRFHKWCISSKDINEWL